MELKVKNLSLLLLLVFLSHCGFLGFGSSATGDSSTVTGAGGEEGGSGSSGSGSSGSGDGSSGSGTASGLPTSSNPPPAVTKAKVIVAAADSESEVPVIGYDGAVALTGTDDEGTDYDISTDTDGDEIIDDYQVAVSTSEITDTTTAICDQATCCDITTAGSFECFLSASNADTVYTYVTDGSTISEKISDTVNTSLLYLGASPTDVAASEYGLDLSDLGITEGGVVMTLANEKIIPIVNDNGSFMVKGNHADNYALANATGADKLAFNPTQNYLSGLVSDTGFDYAAFDPSRFDFGTWGQETNTGALSFTAIKPSTDTDFLFRYAIEPVAADQSMGFICSFSATSSCSADTINNKIHFFETGDLVSGANHKKTIAFDIDDTNIALAVFEDTDNKINIGAGERNYDMRITPKTWDTANGSSYDFTASDFGNMFIYTAQSGTSEGRALLLDKTNSKVWFISYYLDFIGSSSAVTNALISGTNSVSVGSNSQGIVLNADKTKAYVVSQGDDKVYVIDFAGVTDTATTFDISNVSVSTLILSDYVGEKSITLTPNSITYQTISDSDAATTDPEYLLIGLQGIKTNLVIEL